LRDVLSFGKKSGPQITSSPHHVNFFLVIFAFSLPNPENF
jgi:hypothetical protein